MNEIPLSSKLNTDTGNITVSPNEDTPLFKSKQQLFWNGMLRNTNVTRKDGFVLTSGENVKVQSYDNGKEGTYQKKGAEIVKGNSKIQLPYTSVLKDFFKTKSKSSGEQIAHAFYNGRIITLYKTSQKAYTLVETDREDNLIKMKQIENVDSAMITSVYETNEQPVLFVNIQEQSSVTDSSNTVKVYNLFDYFDFEENTPKYEQVLNPTIKDLVDSAFNKWQAANKEFLEAWNKWEISDKTNNDIYRDVMRKYRTALDLEKEYLKQLYDYNPLEEVKFLETRIKELETRIKAIEDEISKLKEDVTFQQLELYEQQLKTLEERRDATVEEINDLSFPSLSPEQTEVLNDWNARIDKARAEYETAYKELASRVATYRVNLKNYTVSSSLSIPDVGTIYATWYGSRLEAQTNKNLFDFITEINSTKSYSSCYSYSISNSYVKAYSYGGTLAGVNVNFGYGFSGTPGTSTAANRRYYYITNDSNYNSQALTGSKNGNGRPSAPYGFSWRLVAGWADVNNAKKKYDELLEVYEKLLEEYNSFLTSSSEFKSYFDILSTYQNLKQRLSEILMQIEELKQNISLIESQVSDINRSLKFYEEELSVLKKQLEQYQIELKRAKAKKVEYQPVYDKSGQPIYETLEEIFEWKSSDNVPLGEAFSGTTFRDSAGYRWIVIGFDDDDKNRALTIYWNEEYKEPKTFKWFGCVDVKGVITGEPIPDPDIFLYKDRRDNGTYAWDMQNGTKTYNKIDGQIICGYEFNKNSRKFDKITVETWKGVNSSTECESVRINISVNDTLTDDEKKTNKVDPKQYFVSNFADSRGIYYDYGLGWVRCYVRKIRTSGAHIDEMYIYTYGSISNSNLKYTKESLIAKGKTTDWTYKGGELNKRIYTVGGNNKADSSILSTLPFSVDILGDEKLRMQMYGLAILSFSYDKSLVANGDEHGDRFVVQCNNDEIILSNKSMVYVIKKTSDFEDFKLWKVADYMFQTNILSNDNVVIEDRDGNISVERDAIPYSMDCILDIEKLALEAPAHTDLTTNNTWYWAAAYNPFFTKGVNSSYLMPAISLPIWVKSDQLEQFQEEALEQRGSLIKPILKGLFDEYEGIDVFYTVSTVTTTLYYKTTNKVKTSDLATTEWDVFGKETYDVNMKDTIYSVSAATQYFPIAVGSIVSGINYVTPSVNLEDENAVRLYTNSNRLYSGYLFVNRIYAGSQIFTIYGRNYYYDMQGIYFIGTSDTYTSNQFVCYVLGMKYLASSGSEAYFYSEFDKQIYIFTGSNTLQRMVSLSDYEPIVDSMYSSHEQALYLLTKDNKLLIMSEDDTACIEDIVVNGHLEGTDQGCAIVNEKEMMLISPYKDLGDHYNFNMTTVNIGRDSSQSKLSYFDYVLYRLTDEPITVKLKVKVINGIEITDEEKNITIQPNQWKGNHYRIRYSPQNNVGNSFAVGLTSDDQIAVAFHGWEVSEIGTGAAPRI